MKKTLQRLVVGLSLVPLVWVALTPPTFLAQKSRNNKNDQTSEFEQVVRPFLVATCYQCHDAKGKSGGLNLEALQSAASIAQHREVWERIVSRLRRGEMPP